MRVVVCICVLMMCVAVARQGVPQEGKQSPSGKLIPFSPVAVPPNTCLLYPNSDPVGNYQEFWLDYNHNDCNSPVSGYIVAHKDSVWPQFCYTEDPCDCLAGAAVKTVSRLRNGDTEDVEDFPGLVTRAAPNDPVIAPLTYNPTNYPRPVLNNPGNSRSIPQYYRIKIDRSLERPGVKDTVLFQVHRIRFPHGREILMGKESNGDTGGVAPIDVNGYAVRVDKAGRVTDSESYVYRLADGFAGRERLAPVLLLVAKNQK